MPGLRLRRKVTPWGHAFGIRLTRAEVERLGLRPYGMAEIEVRSGPTQADFSHLTTLRLGRQASEGHDELIGQGIDADR